MFGPEVLEFSSASIFTSILSSIDVLDRVISSQETARCCCRGRIGWLSAKASKLSLWKEKLGRDDFLFVRSVFLVGFWWSVISSSRKVSSWKSWLVRAADVFLGESQSFLETISGFEGALPFLCLRE